MNRCAKRLATCSRFLSISFLFFEFTVIPLASAGGYFPAPAADVTLSGPRWQHSLLTREVGNFAIMPACKEAAQTKRISPFVVDLFQTNCARCHGADGRGDTPLGHTYNAPDFTDSDWWRKHSDIATTGRLVSIVNHGKGGMPAFAKKLKATEIKMLVSYVRRFRKK